MGIAGGVIIVPSGAASCQHAAFELSNVELCSGFEDGIRAALARIDDVRVCDLHSWSFACGTRGSVFTLIGRGSA
jgi:hypothetical protein